MHISDLGGLYVDPKALKRTTLKVPESQLLQFGDVILSSRGYFKAVVFNSRLSAVASLSVFVIRLQTNSILPEYLAICLNSAEIQNFLEQAAKGSIMRSLRLRDLIEMKIPVIGLDKQKMLVKLAGNLERQNLLLETRREILNSICRAATQKQLQGAEQ